MPIVVPSVGTPTRRSLANCRRILARRLNSLTLVTTTGTAPDSTSIVSSSLALALNDSNRYRNHWLYVYDGTQAGTVRKIGDAALITVTGQLRVSPAFLAPVANGTSVEIHKHLPPVNLDGYTGLNDCLNMALREVWVIDRLTLTTVTNQATYDLGTMATGMADWLDAEAIVEFYGPQVASWLGLAPWGGFQARQDAETVAIDVSPGLTGGQSATVEITRPGNTYMKLDGTTWTDNQDGFTGDLDESLFRPEILAEVALVYAYESLADSSEGSSQARWTQLAVRQRNRVNAWKLQKLPHPSRRPSTTRSPDMVFGYGWGDRKSYWT